jgi:hypothetical protein
MEVLIVLVGLLIVLITFELLSRLFLKRKKKFSPEDIAFIEEYLGKIQELPFKERIFEYDKLLDYCLEKKGLEGTIGVKMSLFGESFQDANAIWEGHKMRNRLAHEMNIVPRESEVIKHSQAYEREIRAFLV